MKSNTICQVILAGSIILASCQSNNSAKQDESQQTMNETVMNKVILMGRLTREPDVRYSQNADGSMAVARYTLAVDRRRGRNSDNEQSADFISCVAFGRAGEFAEKYLHQGTKIVVTGRIQTGSYTNKDGQRVYTTDVVVEEQEFAESKSSAAANSGAAYTPSRPEPSAAAGDGFMNIPCLLYTSPSPRDRG